MLTWVFCICRNESRMLPYFLRHYTTFADKLIFYDDQSDDGTRAIIQACPQAELRDWPGTHGLADDEFVAFANEQWKEARGHAEWVAWVDADEFIYHPEISAVLARYLAEGVDIPQIQGFGMVSKTFPTTTGQITDEIKTGFPSPEWNKHEIFRTAMSWNIGRHSLDWERIGPYKTSAQAELKLLHYRYLGADYVQARNQNNFSRQPERCRRLNYGNNVWPDATKPYSTNWFMGIKDQEFPNVI